MKKITFKALALTFILGVTLVSYSQEQPRKFGKYPVDVLDNGVVRCATYQNELMIRDANPNRGTEEQFENWISQKIEEFKLERIANPKSANAVKMIPVVVHVIHNGDAVGTNENLSLERIQSQIAVLNEDYGQIDGSNGGDITGLGVNTGIQFCLAKIDYEGNPTDGVDRKQYDVALYTTTAQVNEVKLFTQWDPEKYLNIWTFNWGGNSDLKGLLGYAQFPSLSGLSGLDSNGGEDYTDGVAINHINFGSSEKTNSGPFEGVYNLGRTTTHEIGHFLGLRHIWGDYVGCSGNGDYCDDTPPQNNLSQGCPVGVDTCPGGGPDMYENYMDYTNDACMSVFTANQKTRMETVLANSLRRKGLLTSTVCGTLGTPDFKSLQGIFVSPNPAQDVINITTETETPDSYTIFNNLGQVITTVSNVSDANLSINISNYTNGIYFLKIDKGSETKTIKFIKN